MSSKKLLWGAGLALLSLGGASLLKKKLIPEPKVPNNLQDDVVLFFQRDYSPYCVKVKKIMDYKGIPYKNIDTLPMLHKKFMKDISGQPLVPVIKYKGEIVSDSTKIAHYLEEIKPEPSIFIKDDQKLNQEVLMLEDWADEVFVQPFSKLAIMYNADHPEIAIESKEFNTGVDIIDNNKEKVFPVMLKIMAKGYGADVSQKAEIKKKARMNLSILMSKLDGKEFLVGDRLTLADIAIASHLTVAQKIPYLAEDEEYSSVFEWQSKILKMTERRLAGAI